MRALCMVVILIFINVKLHEDFPLNNVYYYIIIPLLCHFTI